jgi:hypothetical protein
VTTPVAGSGERTALLNAVRKKLGTTSQLYVYQLYVLGDTAIADVEPVSGDGQRSFVALANGPKWTAVWAAPFGSSKANKASATAALPAFSSDLIDKVGWTVAKPPVTSEASMRASLSVNAKKWVENDIGSGQGQPYKITTLKVAKDSKGVWWGVITIQPGVDASGQPFEPYRYWAKFSDGAWSEQFLGTEPPAPSSYFPASVISKLGL